MVKQPLPRSALIGSPVSGHVPAENKTVFSQSDEGKNFPSLAKKTQTEHQWHHWPFKLNHKHLKSNVSDRLLLVTGTPHCLSGTWLMIMFLFCFVFFPQNIIDILSCLFCKYKMHCYERTTFMDDLLIHHFTFWIYYFFFFSFVFPFFYFFHFKSRSFSHIKVLKYFLIPFWLQKV